MPNQRHWTNYWEPCEFQTGDILETYWCSGVRDATTTWAAVRVDAVTSTTTNSTFAWMSPGSNYMTFEVSWDLVDSVYVPVVSGLYCTNVPAGSCNESNPPTRYYDAKSDTNFNLLLPATNAPGEPFTVILHNTTNALLYNLVSYPTLQDGVSKTNWPSELLVWGADGTTNTEVTVQMDGRDNLFLWAYSISNWPTVVGLDRLYSTGIVNGVWTNFPEGNVAAVTPILHSLNMGYKGEDHYGVLWGMPDPEGRWDTDPFQEWTLEQQGVTSLALDPSARLSVTNVLMSHNPITSVDLGNCEKLITAEFFQCEELATVSLTNCPNLFRACFEQCNLSSIDYSGCPNLVDIRLARNQLAHGGDGVTNIVLGSAGPKLRHFCIHTNRKLAPLDLSSLYSVQELWFKDCNQSGVLAPVSTNLWSVWAEDQYFTSADFTGRNTMVYCTIQNNLLTDLVLTGCSSLTNLQAQNNLLGTNQLDAVLYALRDVCTNITFADLRDNGCASSSGYAAVNTITNRGVRLLIDYPEEPVVDTNNVPGTNLVTDLTFVTEESRPDMQVRLTGTNVTVFWHWGDGQTNQDSIANASDYHSIGQPANDFPSPAARTNYVRITPPSALVGFGIAGGHTGNSGGHISYAQNLPAFTNLAYLWLWRDNLRGIDLTNCPSLKELHLAGNTNTFSTDQMNQAFIAVAGTCTRTNSVDPPNDWKFFYPPGTGPGAPDFTDSAVSNAWQALYNRKWTLSTSL